MVYPNSKKCKQHIYMIFSFWLILSVGPSFAAEREDESVKSYECNKSQLLGEFPNFMTTKLIKGAYPDQEFGLYRVTNESSFPITISRVFRDKEKWEYVYIANANNLYVSVSGGEWHNPNPRLTDGGRLEGEEYILKAGETLDFLGDFEENIGCPTNLSCRYMQEFIYSVPEKFLLFHPTVPYCVIGM